MLPDMLLPPFNVDYVAKFDSFIHVDNRDLTALTLFAGSTGGEYAAKLRTARPRNEKS